MKYFTKVLTDLNYIGYYIVVLFMLMTVNVHTHTTVLDMYDFEDILNHLRILEKNVNGESQSIQYFIL